MTGIGIGMAIGSFASGYVIDEFGARNGFWVSVVAGAVALATALLATAACARRRKGSRARRRSPDRPLPSMAATRTARS